MVVVRSDQALNSGKCLYKVLIIDNNNSLHNKCCGSLTNVNFRHGHVCDVSSSLSALLLHVNVLKAYSSCIEWSLTTHPIAIPTILAFLSYGIRQLLFPEISEVISIF